MRTWQQAIRAARTPWWVDALRTAEQLFWYAVFMAGVFGLGIVVIEAFRHH